MKSVMTHQFSQIPRADIQRSSFDRSHGHKTTFDAGWLIPVYIDEALPGDTFKMNMSAFARLATPLKPVMDNMFMESFFFAVPVRLVWSNWKRFNGEQDTPASSTSYVVPQMTGPNVAAGGIAEGSLSDYFGIPTKALNGGGATTGITFNSLWHRGYNLIWNEWFRDQNLQNSEQVDTGDGPDTYSLYSLHRRGKRHDYFTSALPWPQKGPDVTLPLGTRANVFGIGTFNQGSVPTDHLTNITTGAAVHYNPSWIVDPSAAGGADAKTGFVVKSLGAGPTYDSPDIWADLSTATAATINALRQSFQLQKMYERDARGGTRYTEIIKSHFGVTSPDARLQRPEYLGGGSSVVNVHPVAQATPTPAGGVTTPQGNLAAFGTASFSGHGFTKSFTEHCLLFGMVSVRADITYQQGINRMFNRRTRFDYFWPALAHLGEQSILNREIYANLADGTGAAQKDGIFGYQERYAEYRYKPSMVTGQFRSNATTPLDMWHLAYNFSSQPLLNGAFIAEDPPIDRVIAVPSEPHFIFDSFFRLNCARPMPVYSVPGLIDHF